MNVRDEAFRLRKIAEAGPVGKRQSSFELYDLLGQCMALAETCAEGEAYEQIRQLVTQQPHTGNRRYVERTADGYLLVCRFIFGDLKSEKAQRSNASRYASAMREARKAKIGPAKLAAHLSNHGGINALFLRRPLIASSVTTKTLYLATPITIKKGAPFTLQLRRLADNRYEVLACEESTSS